MATKRREPIFLGDLTLTYRAHCLNTNYAQGVQDFMKLHGIPGGHHVTNLITAQHGNFDRLILVIDGASFVIEKGTHRY